MHDGGGLRLGTLKPSGWLRSRILTIDCVLWVFSLTFCLRKRPPLARDNQRELTFAHRTFCAKARRYGMVWFLSFATEQFSSHRLCRIAYLWVIGREVGTGDPDRRNRGGFGLDVNAGGSALGKHGR